MIIYINNNYINNGEKYESCIVISQKNENVEIITKKGSSWKTKKVWENEIREIIIEIIKVIRLKRRWGRWWKGINLIRNNTIRACNKFRLD